MRNTDSSEDVLRREAVDLATDVAAVLLDLRAIIAPRDAYLVSMECVRIADRIQRARAATEREEIRTRFREGRTAAQRALVALERMGAIYGVPRKHTDGVYRRIHLLATTLNALAALA